jgi:hypothetical protein
VARSKKKLVEVGQRIRVNGDQVALVTEVFHVGGMPWAGLPPCDVAVLEMSNGSVDRIDAETAAGLVVDGA